VTQATGSPGRGFHPYPAYRDSAVEWTGKIPKGWCVKPLKRLVVLNPDVLPEETAPDFTFRYVDISSVDSDGRIGEGEVLPFSRAPSRARRRVLPGDCVISTVRTYLKAIGRVGRDAPELVFSTGFAVLRSNEELNSDFLFYALQAEPFIQGVVAHSEGVGYPAIGPSELGCLPIVLPGLPEQRIIATFLDRETAKIDALVAKEEWLIELLDEKRAALITHAVTRGLDPNVPMKESGVEWLGLVPAHWRIEPLKRIGVLEAGAGFPDTDQGLPDEELPFYKVSDMNLAGNDVFMTNHNNSVTYASAARLGANVFAAGSIVFPKVGAALLTNKRRILTRQACLDNNMMALEVRDGLVKFLFYRLVCLDMARLSNPGAVPSLNESQAREIVVGVPSDLEQRAIAEFLDKKTARLDALIVKIREAIEKLLEYRTALISAAVTGKVDVRGCLGSRIEGDASKQGGR
jgi:type I restriction enzyme S subunit